MKLKEDEKSLHFVVVHYCKTYKSRIFIDIDLRHFQLCFFKLWLLGVGYQFWIFYKTIVYGFTLKIISICLGLQGHGKILLKSEWHFAVIIIHWCCFLFTCQLKWLSMSDAFVVYQSVKKTIVLENICLMPSWSVIKSVSILISKARWFASAKCNLYFFILKKLKKYVI